MKFPLLFCLVFVSISAVSQSIFRCDNGTVQFSSDARLELIKASSHQLKGVIDTAKKIFAFSVDATSFEGFNSPLQKEHFNENYMETYKIRNITFKGKIIEDINYSEDGTYTVRTKGTLNVHGIEQERIIKSTVRITKGSIELESGFNVFLKDHNIKIPKVVHENVATEIAVHVSATLNPKPE